MTQAVERAINYTFKKSELLAQALTHPSTRMRAHYERLEFLGDAVLEVIISELLFHNFPQADEGELSKMRATLVNAERLSAHAKLLGLDKALQVGQANLRKQGRHQQSMHAAAFEALIGALYLDAGFSHCQKSIAMWFAEDMQTVRDLMQEYNAKSQLQEWAQAQRLPLPSYTITETEGEAHALSFTVQCMIEGKAYVAEATATNRRTAEQQAAAMYLQYLSEQGHD